MKLNIEYKFLDHPYADEPGSKGERWSEIKLEIVDGEGLTVKTAFDWQWDIIVFLTWLLENEAALRYEVVPDSIKSSSIAKGIFDFYRELDPDIDDLNIVDQIYDYRTRHGLRFALAGTDIDNIYIGLNGACVTISFYKNKKNTGTIM